MYRGDIRLGATLDFKFTTRQFSAGGPFTLAGTPSLAAYVDNGTTEITAGLTLTVDFDSKTGLNHVRVVASSANGFAAGTNVQIVIAVGTVDGVSVANEVVGEFSIEARSALMPATAGRTLVVESDGVAHADVKEWLGVAPLALASQRVVTDAQAISGDATAADTLELFAEAVDQSTGQLDAGSFVAGAFAAVWDEATRTLTAFDATFKTGYSLSAAGVQAVWDALTSALTTAGSIGKLLVDNINATISSRALQTTADTIASHTDDIGVAGAGLTAIPDSAGVTTLLSRIPAALFAGITSLAEWLGLIAGKQTGDATALAELRATGAGSGTYDETADSQEAIRDRGDAAWAGGSAPTVEEIADEVETRSLIVGTNNDKTDYSIGPGGISAASFEVDAVDADALAASAVAEIQSGLATAAVLTTVANRLGAWTGSARNTILGAFQALFRKDTDATVPSDVNADLGGGAGAANNTTDSTQAIRDNMGTPQTGDAFARLGAPAGASVSADVAAVKAQAAALEVDTQDVQSRLPAALQGGRMDASVGAMANDVVTADALSQAAAREVADEVLDRNLAGGGSGNTRNVRNALRTLRNRVRDNGGTLEVYEEDDTTIVWQGTTGRDAAADPLVEVNPA